MKVYVAKQPIYDINEHLVGYELFYREDCNNAFPQIDEDQATAEVIINTHLNIGLHRITGGKPYCIQFTETLLKQKLPNFFNPEEIVVKLSNNMTLSKEIIEIVGELKQLGYRIVMNETLIHKDFPFLEDILCNIEFLEVDFSNGVMEHHHEIERLARKHEIQLLAEKIETPDLYVQAKKRGYSLFQGYLFSEPVIESTFEIPAVFGTKRMLENYQIDSMKEDEIVELIEKDLSFSIKLLRLMNTNWSQTQKVCSIRTAILLIGLEEVQKWIQLLSIRYSLKAPIQLSEEMNRLTLTRAKLCENIGILMGSPYPAGYYLIGLISIIEKFNYESMEEILDGIPIKEEIYEALMGMENKYKLVLDLVQAVEQANWKEISEKSIRLQIPERDVFRLYAESLNWSKDSIPLDQDQDPFNLH